MTTSAAEAFPLSDRPDPGAVGACLAELFGTHGAALLGLCRVLLRDREEAEDAVQQTFLSAYTSLLNGVSPSHPAAWLATIARNECRGRVEQRMRSPLRVPQSERPLPDPVAAAAANADLAALWRAIGELPRRQRKAILLREFSGLSYGELAAALGVSEPTVESLLFRARRELRTRLRPASGSAACLAPLAAIREALARAIGGMPDPSAGAVAGLASATPIVAKLAAGAAMVAVAGGTVAVVERQSGDRSPARPPVGSATARYVARSVAVVPVRSVHAAVATKQRTHNPVSQTVASVRRHVPVTPARRTPTTLRPSTPAGAAPVEPVATVVSGPPPAEPVPSAETTSGVPETTEESTADDSAESAAGTSDDGQTVTGDDEGSTGSGSGDGDEGSSEGPGSGSSGSGSESEGSSASSGDGSSGSTETAEVETDGGGGNSGPGGGGSESSGEGSGGTGSGSSGSDD